MKVRTISVWLAALTMVSLSSSALAKAQVPIKGEFATEFTFSSPPPVAHLTLSGSGWASHLGKATCFSGNEVVDFTQQPLPTLTGTLTLTAANGDTLTGEMDAIAIPAQDGSITFFGTLTITGGTGRFANAKSELQAALAHEALAALHPLALRDTVCCNIDNRAYSIAVGFDALELGLEPVAVAADIGTGAKEFFERAFDDHRANLIIAANLVDGGAKLADKFHVVTVGRGTV